MNWWANKIPDGAEEAIRSAKDRGKPLGFNIEEMIQTAEKEKMMRQQA